jgi:NADH-quinone oxidoreductase subunit M
MVAHGFSTAALFLTVGYMVRRGKSRNIADYGGLFRAAPLLSGAFLIAGLSGLALPGMASFPGEFLVLVGSFTRFPVLAIIATLAVVLSAVYILWLYQRVATGEPRGVVSKFSDLTRREATAIIPILGLTIALGVFPQVLIAPIEPAVQTTLEQVDQIDPLPYIGEPATTKEAGS